MSPPPPALVWEPLIELHMHNHRQVQYTQCTYVGLAWFYTGKVDYTVDKA